MINRQKIRVPKPYMAQVSTEKFEEKIAPPLEGVVQNRYSHISAGTELACIAGLESFFAIPDIPGYSAIGRVLKTGDEMKGALKFAFPVYSFDQTPGVNFR